MSDETYTLRLRNDRLDLGYLVGDYLTVIKADTAKPGQHVITAQQDGTTRVNRHDGTGNVIARVVQMNRRIVGNVS